MKTALVVLLFSLAAVAQQNGPNPADSHLPLPKPLATVNIVDDSAKDAPIKCFGTADAYMKPISGDRIMAWIEENNLHVQNVSSRPILNGKMEVWTSDIKGTRYHIGIELCTYKPSQTRKFLGVKVPGSDNHLPLKHAAKYASADYHLMPDVAPTAIAHVLSVTFADGSTWEAPKTK